MAISYSCDGCGSPVENPRHVGKVLKREYCDACVPKAEAFIVAEETLRVETQVEFASKRQSLIDSYAIKLPDVP